MTDKHYLYLCFLLLVICLHNSLNVCAEETTALYEYNNAQGTEIEVPLTNDNAWYLNGSGNWVNINQTPVVMPAGTITVRIQVRLQDYLKTLHSYDLRLWTAVSPNNNYSVKTVKILKANASDSNATFTYNSVQKGLEVNTYINSLKSNYDVGYVQVEYDNTTTNNPNSSSVSVFVRDIKLFMKETTIEDKVIDIDDKLGDTNEKLDDVNNNLEEIDTDIKGLPGKIGDMIKGLFVPTSDDINNIIERFDTLLENRLGAIWQVVTIPIDMINIFINSGAERDSKLNIPKLSIQLPDNEYVIYQGGMVDIIPFSGSVRTTLVNSIRFGFNLVATLLFIRNLNGIYNSIFNAEYTSAINDETR